MNNDGEDSISDSNAHAVEGDSYKMMPGDPSRPGQSRFRVTIDADRLASTPPKVSYFEWSITDPIEILGEKEDTIMGGADSQH